MNNFNKNLPYNPPVQPTAPKGEVGTYIIIAVVAFALGLGSGWLWTQKNIEPVSGVNNKAAENTNIVTNQTPTGDLAVGDSILVKDQLAGVEVMVEQVVLANIGWVVTREDDGKGAPGKILGAQLFDAGAWENGKVELLRGTEAGGTYYALIYSDNGDRAFDPKLDTPLTDATGQLVMATFKAN